MTRLFKIRLVRGQRPPSDATLFPAGDDSQRVPSTRSLAAVAAVAALVAVSLAAAVGGPAAAAPPPEDVCGTCGSYFETAVADAGGPVVAVTESRPGVNLHANGTATVFSWNVLRPAAADWVANNTDAVARELAASDAGLAETKPNLSVELVGGEARVTYTDRDFAHRSVGGTLVVDAFTRTPTGWEVNAGAFHVWAPGSYAAVTHERGAFAVSWTDSIDTEHVVFAPDSGLTSVAAGRLALVIETAPAFLRGAAIALLPFVGALALLFRGVDVAAELLPDADSRTAGGVVAAASAAVLVGLLATRRVSLYFMLPGAVVLCTAATGVAVGAAAYRGVERVRTLALAAVGVPLALGAVAALVGAYAHPAVAGWTIGRALSAGCLAAQVGVFAVLGATRERDGTSRWRRFAAAAAPPVAVVALIGPTAVVLAWVPLLAVLAPLAYLLGAAVGRTSLRSV
jgi:hypothetical protein